MSLETTPNVGSNQLKPLPTSKSGEISDQDKSACDHQALPTLLTMGQANQKVRHALQ
jgi:hypothetical protein